MIYLDNAATTAPRKEVKEYMFDLMDSNYGNPSSTHSIGRKAKVILETSRKNIAKHLGCLPAEIIFCSGGTEADNAALNLALRDLGVKKVISLPTEHYAVLHAAEKWCKAFNAELELLPVNNEGEFSLIDLERSLQSSTGPCLVTIMHGNNEIGNLADLEAIAVICEKHDAYFHSDTVQTVGHFPLDFKNLGLHFASGAAHKFNGPKGIGFLYIKQSIRVGSFITGGSQERGLRGGTESIYLIGGMSRAMDLAYANLSEESSKIKDLRQRLWLGLQNIFPTIYRNGLSGQEGKSLYTVLSVSIPEMAGNEMLLFNLDLKGLCVSGGSACSSGSNQKSHVIAALNPNHKDAVIRLSLSKDNTPEEIDQALAIFSELAKSK
jgi:cysteine desulfurase